MAPVELKIRDVLIAARKAYNDGRLTGLNNYEICCMYRYPDGGCCAVGAALSDEDAQRFDQNEGGTGVIALLQQGHITCDFDLDLQALQAAHDAQDEGIFLEDLGELEKKHGLA